jgi:hypothetical protein
VKASKQLWNHQIGGRCTFVFFPRFEATAFLIIFEGSHSLSVSINIYPYLSMTIHIYANLATSIHIDLATSIHIYPCYGYGKPRTDPSLAVFGPPPLPCYDGRGFQSVHPRHGDTATRRALDFSRRATMAGDQDEVCWRDISGYPMGTVEEILHQLLITSDNYEKL